MLDGPSIAEALCRLINLLGVQTVTIDPTTPAGRLASEALASLPIPPRRAPWSSSGAPQGATDFVHIGDRPPRQALDQAWARMSERAVAVVEGADRPEALDALQTHAAASGAALLEDRSTRLRLLTENAGLESRCVEAGWNVLAPARPPPGKPGRRSRLLYRRPSGLQRQTSFLGDSPEHAAEGAARYEAIRSTGHVRRYVLEDALVFGDMTVFGKEGLVREMNRLVPRQQSRETYASLGGRDWPILDRALLIGVATNENYYHWMTESLFSLWLGRRNAHDRTAPAIVPPLTPFQAETLDLLEIGRDKICELQPEEARRVRALSILSPTFGELAERSSPRLTAMFRRLRAATGTPADAMQARKLYISRIDSPHRPLTNEAELSEALAERGFDIVTLTGRSLGEQARLFNEAAIVVAPHGAGLTNLGFCRPGARVLELTPSHYINPCFVAISELLKLRHDIYVGTSRGRTEQRHRKPWTVRLDRVLAVVDGLLDGSAPVSEGA